MVIASRVSRAVGVRVYAVGLMRVVIVPRVLVMGRSMRVQSVRMKTVPPGTEQGDAAEQGCDSPNGSFF